MPWRVVLTDQRGRPHSLTVRDVAELRAHRERVLSDPRISSWRYWKLPEDLPAACPAGHDYWPGQVSSMRASAGSDT